ncbi:VOC family protein, partial [Enterococcus lactis]|uniref:VOC family protein n=1 Tax=Enterococcus lactis TaxID=357441 RepID=UPI0031CD303B
LTTIDHIAIFVSDYQKSRDFYVNKLGFEVIRENYRKERVDYKLDLKLGSAELEIFGIANVPQRPNYPEGCGLGHLAFQVDDIDEPIAELQSLG